MAKFIDSCLMQRFFQNHGPLMVLREFTVMIEQSNKDRVAD